MNSLIFNTAVVLALGYLILRPSAEDLGQITGFDIPSLAAFEREEEEKNPDPLDHLRGQIAELAHRFESDPRIADFRAELEARLEQMPKPVSERQLERMIAAAVRQAVKSEIAASSGTIVSAPAPRDNADVPTSGQGLAVGPKVTAAPVTAVSMASPSGDVSDGSAAESQPDNGPAQKFMSRRDRLRELDRLTADMQSRAFSSWPAN